MGAIWKFFSGEDDTPPAPEQSARRDLEPVDEHAATAYHEAGHARAARIGGATVLDINAYPNGGGLTRWDWKPFRENRWTWGTRRYTEEHKRRTELTIYVAGQESECRYLMDRYGYSYKKALRETDPGASSDQEKFKQRAEGTGYTWESMRGEVHGLVRRHAYTIETNAKPLKRKGHRDGTWA
ncbi:MAG TPA: hypothetical protein VFA63_06700 [Pseudonocardiaceae bacterium]|nr:hypothetical protein [Pseudonocardiaceae bacterium]